jgi:hypothetical protein
MCYVDRVIAAVDPTFLSAGMSSIAPTPQAIAEGNM